MLEGLTPGHGRVVSKPTLFETASRPARMRIASGMSCGSVLRHAAQLSSPKRYPVTEGAFSGAFRILVKTGETMNIRVVLLSALFLALSAPVWAADVTGNWQVTIISTSEGTMNGKASLKQTGHTVAGWLGPSENDPIPITATVKGEKLTIRTHPQPGRTVAFAECELTVNDDKMVGTIDTDKGKIEFVRSSREYNEPLRWPGR
jgi:hypothetical protein